MDGLIAEQLAVYLNLKPLPVEGGLFARTYLSQDEIRGYALPARYSGQTHASGSAIFMLYTDEPDCFSAMHRLKTDEIIHFYLGDPFEFLLLYPDGSSRIVTMGQDILNGQWVQFVVPAGVWQGSRLKPGGKFALFGTTMAPAFHATDFEAAERQSLIAAYPHEEERITLLTRLEGDRFMQSGQEA